MLSISIALSWKETMTVKWTIMIDGKNKIGDA
jgi:hypothetical protein